MTTTTTTTYHYDDAGDLTWKEGTGSSEWYASYDDQHRRLVEASGDDVTWYTYGDCVVSSP